MANHVTSANCVDTTLPEHDGHFDDTNLLASDCVLQAQQVQLADIRHSEEQADTTTTRLQVAFKATVDHIWDSNANLRSYNQPQKHVCATVPCFVVELS